MNERSKIAIVGANGFVGRHLAAHLAAIPGIDLSLYGRQSAPTAITSGNYSRLDITDPTAIKDLLQPADIVYLLTSATIPANSWTNPMAEVTGNLIPFLNILDHLAHSGTRKVVFVSSAGTIYGPAPEKVSETSYTNPFSPYGIAKLTMEHFLNYYKVRFGIDFDVFRVSNVYGEGQNTSKGLGIINTFLENILHHNKVTIFGDGENIRNYIYVRDLAHLLSLSATGHLPQSGVYNLASNDTLSINQLVSIMRDIVDSEFVVEKIPARSSDNSIIIPGNDKLIAAVPGFVFTPIAQGIQETYQAIQRVYKPA